MKNVFDSEVMNTIKFNAQMPGTMRIGDLTITFTPYYDALDFMSGIYGDGRMYANTQECLNAIKESALNEYHGHIETTADNEKLVSMYELLSNAIDQWDGKTGAQGIAHDILCSLDDAAYDQKEALLNDPDSMFLDHEWWMDCCTEEELSALLKKYGRNVQKRLAALSNR